MLAHILEMSHLSRAEFEAATLRMKERARVALHFHPDRPGPDHRTVVETLLESGHYKSQFETFVSNGALAPESGGPRDLWEAKLFDGAFNEPGVTAAHRPKYGSLDLFQAGDGPSPRFGSCYFLLDPVVTRRCTFTYTDSHTDPREKGTWDEFDDVLCALFTESFSRGSVLGRETLPAGLLDHFLKMDDRRGEQPSRNLDFYIEAQIHGPISLAEHVDILVADPSYREDGMLQDLCGRYQIELRWHGGFRLPVAQVPQDFRGPTMPSLARRLAEDEVSARDIGLAAQELKRSPQAWADRGDPGQVLQELKRLWHVLLRYGRWSA